MKTVTAQGRPLRTEHERAAHLVDVAAVRRALTGTPTALTKLEQGATIALCDVDGMDRELTGRSLGLAPKTVGRLIDRRRKAVDAAFKNALAAGMAEPAAGLVDAVRDRDAGAVADLLEGLSVQGLYALAVVLADMAGREPDADDAPPPRP